MAASLCHLDLLLQLQAESFQEMLEWHVSIHYVLQIARFSVWPLETILPWRVQFLLSLLLSLQGWPCDDIGPSEPLMLLCSYENHMGKTINPKELEDGSVQLKDLLTEEDFKMARLVIVLSLNP